MEQSTEIKHKPVDLPKLTISPSQFPHSPTSRRHFDNRLPRSWEKGLSLDTSLWKQPDSASKGKSLLIWPHPILMAETSSIVSISRKYPSKLRAYPSTIFREESPASSHTPISFFSSKCSLLNFFKYSKISFLLVCLLYILHDTIYLS